MSDQPQITITAQDLETMYRLNQELKANVEELSGKVTILEAKLYKLENRVPSTNLLSHSLFVRALTVTVYTALISALFSLPLLIIPNPSFQIPLLVIGAVIIIAAFAIVKLITKSISKVSHGDPYEYNEVSSRLNIPH